MIPNKINAELKSLNTPRMSGDDPEDGEQICRAIEYSPHERG